MDWQPIETAPKDGTPVDLWATWPGNAMPPRRIPDAFWNANRGEWSHSAGYTWLVPTHWMPTPAPPTD